MKRASLWTRTAAFFLIAAAADAHAGYLTTNPSEAGVDPDSVTEIVTARARIQRNDQASWSLILNPSGPNAKIPFADFYVDDTPAPFTFSFDAVTGGTAFRVERPAGYTPGSVEVSGDYDPDLPLVGFRLFTRSNPGDQKTILSDIQVKGSSGTDTIAVFGGTGAFTKDFYFTNPTTSFTLAGNYLFDFNGPSGQESFKFEIRPLQGVVLVPEPSSVLLMGLGLGACGILAARHRRRQARSRLDDAHANV